MKEKVIISVTNDLSIDQRVNRIARTLTDAGYEVLVLGRKLKPNYDDSHLPYRIKRFALIFNKGKFFYLEYWFRAFWFLLFQRVDILNSNDLDSLLPNFLVSRLKGKRLVYDSHEYFTEVPELMNRPFTRKMWLNIEKWIFPKLKKAYTVNDMIAKLYQEKYKVEVGVVRNMPFRNEASKERENISNVLLYQGALNKGRGLDLLLRSIQFVNEKELWIAGFGDEEENLRKLAEELKLKEKVKFLGSIPIHELKETTLKAALGFSLEEDLGMNYRLASPNKLYDYIQCGVPSIVSDLPGLRQITEQVNSGWILDKEERTPEKLAAKIEFAFADIEKWKSISNNCLKAAEELCWEKEQQKLLSYFKK